MNRIYQGRATAFELADDDSGFVAKAIAGTSEGADQSTCPLWQHHAIFQDAINYYLVALGSLVGDQAEAGDRLARDLRERLASAWTQFPRIDAHRKKANSLRKSLTNWLGLDHGASLEEAFATVLDGNLADSRTRYLAMALLLDKCSGDAAIQQGGRGYLPRFCAADASPSYDFSAETLKAASGYDRLAEALHGESPLEGTQLAALANDLQLSWTVKLQPGKTFDGDEAKARLREAVEHLQKTAANPPNKRVAEALQHHPQAVSELETLLKKISDLPDQLSIPRNRKASKDVTFTTLAFQFFPSPLTADLLRLFIRRPSAKKDAKNSDSPAIDFAELGDDPIKLARGDRGYVFPAFTALPAWQPQSPGQPTWKEFDIAAFKEALKSLNQFHQKTIERADKLAALNSRFLYSTELDAPWQAAKSSAEGEEEDSHPFKLAGDDRFSLAQSLEKQLTKELNEGAWRITHSSLRGFRDLAEKWNQLHRQRSGKVTSEELSNIVKDYQRDDKNQRSIGSLPLFLTLCEPTYWSLWLEVNEETELQRETDHRPANMLRAVADLHNLGRDLERAKEPIKLTPAEPTHSRRLFMFSDLAGRSKVKFLDEPRIELSIAHRNGDYVSELRARVTYSAPRLHRDHLLGGEESRWLQPMTAALGITGIEPKKFPKFESAVALMPGFTREGELRHLLNFPIDLDASALHEQIGNREQWTNPFHGTREKHLHLHWPGTATTDAAKRSPWWSNPHFIENGFTTLSIDLGQRSAGAWALLRITASDPRTVKPATKRPVHFIGDDGSHQWFAEIIRTGLLRLPGEDQKLVFPDGRRQTEPYGKRGRKARADESIDEYADALALANALLAHEPEQWIGADRNEKSVARQNDSLIALANQRLSRLATFHRWSCFDPDRDEVRERRGKMIENLQKELAAWTDSEINGYSDLIQEQKFAEFRRRAGELFTHLQSQLGDLLVRLANRTVPLRQRSWQWVFRKNADDAATRDGIYGDLKDNGPRPDVTPFIRGQRGLSMARLEQLSRLRSLFLRYNRCFDRKPGEPVPFGASDRGRESGEPCEALLEKIDRAKEQRINQTAHEILAQALGVRLREHRIDKKDRQQRDAHGEYEKIPGREPVDFVVIEDLNRYLTSQGRAPSENSRLMKWAHRAVRDKIKMLVEEPFGIPVVEVAAAYSSRFCSRTGMPGARCEEVADLPHFLRKHYEKKATVETGKDASSDEALYQALLSQFADLDNLNAARRRKDPKAKLHTLLLPRTGGPLFLALDGSQNGHGPLTQADTNAAANLGLRAVAAPTSLHLLHRLRSERRGEVFECVTKNAREKNAYSTRQVIECEKSENSPSKKLRSADRPNFFYDPHHVAKFDRASVKIEDKEIPIAAGVGLWKSVNDRFLETIVEMNRHRIAKWFDADDQIP